MFKSEYLKLQHVYERRNEDVVVASPDKNAVELKENFYEIPHGKIGSEDRVRIEKHGGMILIYHALTNDLLCKYVVPDGEGNIMTLPKKEHILSIEEELLIDYQKYPVAKEFFTKLRKKSPRYVYPQCNRIRRLQKYYTEEQMIDGFEFCVRGDICSVKELCSYFLYRYGEEKAKQYIPVQTCRHYKERADEIREVVMNGNGN